MQSKLSHSHGFSLLEIIISIAILGVISSISVSAYSGYIETSKNSQAVNQVRMLSLLIDDYALDNGKYPESLQDLGNENLKDPWGNPYVYLNLNGNNENNRNDDHGGDNEYSESGDDDDYGSDSEHSERDEHNDHGSDDKHHERDNDDAHKNDNEHNERDEGGTSTNIGSARKDGNLVPINTNYDLCSYGKDGKSKAPLRAKDSHDDIIYANDGGYIGLAEEF